jgi:hypothetical protein
MSTNPHLSDSSKNLVLGPRLVLVTKTDGRLTVGRNITLILTLTLKICTISEIYFKAIRDDTAPTHLDIKLQLSLVIYDM